MLESVEWGEYKLGDLFESSNGDFDIQKTHINDLGTYVITAGLSNNGVLGKSDVQAKIFKKGSITIDMFGAAFYRQFDYKMVTHARVFSLQPKKMVSNSQGLFMVNSLHFLSSMFGYENMCSWSKIKDETIQLPARNGEIDYEFMDRFIAELKARRIAELKARRIAELKAYLTITGLEDYTLTPEEEQAIKDFEAGNVKWGEFDVIKIFDVRNAGNILANEIVEGSGSTPYLCASRENNAVSSYISYREDLLTEGNCIFIGGKTFVVTYQECDFFSNDSHNLTLRLYDSEHRIKLKQLYLATCVNKSLGHKYSWGNSVSNRKIQKDKIMLPCINRQVDFSKMETFISAVQKLVIKDVVLYADREIEATQQVVDQS